jgi:phenylacetate-CoA ligase
MNTIEYTPLNELLQLQVELLQSTLNRVYNRVPSYRTAMDALKCTPEAVTSLADLARLPFTTREDLTANYPYGQFAVPLRDIIRLHTLSCGVSNPIVMGYTKQDVAHRQGLTCRFLSASGVTADDIVQICLDPGMAFLAQELKEAAEAMGALVIPPEPMAVQERLRILADFKTSTLITFSSYLQYLFAELAESGMHLANLSLKRVVLLDEHLDMDAREEMEREFAVDILCGHGILEAVGPVMAYECEKRNGLHLAMDHLIAEVVHPATGAVLPSGEKGELVITTLTTKANPLIRFRTGELTRILAEPCVCGRTTWRMEPVYERTDGLVQVRGLNISLDQVEAFVRHGLARLSRGQVSKAVPHVMAVRKERFLERLELWIAITDEFFAGSLPLLHDWLREMEMDFEDAFGLACRMRPVELCTLQPYLNQGLRVVYL